MLFTGDGIQRDDFAIQCSEQDLPVTESRAGDKTIVRGLGPERGARAGVERIAYVSCNPVSFARDAATLEASGYTLEWLRVVDQFRWSTHIELVAFLRRVDR